MKHRSLSVFVNGAGTVHVEDGMHIASFPNVAAYAAALNARPSTQPMLGIFHALGATGWQLVDVDREPAGGLYGLPSVTRQKSGQRRLLHSTPGTRFSPAHARHEQTPMRTLFLPFGFPSVFNTFQSESVSYIFSLQF
ncbi:hypothetical protein DESA109040_04395 [Deinococcus saxicola]